MAASPYSCNFVLFLSLTFHLFCLSTASSEADILLSFKSTIKDPIKSLSSWSTTSLSHYCNWTGIACTHSPPLSVTSLNLQSFNLSGEISPSICQLHNLSHLNLADNYFNQPIPLHLSQCRSLESLNLSNNLIWGTIPVQISLFRSLKSLDLSNNRVEGKMPQAIGLLENLQVLNFGSNLLSGNVPLVFGNFSELVVLDLSENIFLVSAIPSDIGQLGKLEQLLLRRSGFYGGIPESFVGLKTLKVLDLSQNNLNGKFPQTLGLALQSLVSFDVSANKLSGSFPNGICNSRKNSLTSISLHTNLFSGSIDDDNINQCLNLETFEAQDNDFSGKFPKGLWSLPRIKLIRAENNRFSGQIPESISTAAHLEQVQIDNNSFTGEIPQGLGMVKTLYRFSASGNGLYGELPPNFCDSPVMSITNLSNNSLSGSIPEVRHCKKLVSISLSHNSFAGQIPPSLGELPVLTYLDLSDNNLSGSIPEQLGNLKLALFNVSFNRLSGKVPLSLISGLPASYLQGNPDLCGPGLPHNSCLEDERSWHQISGLTKLGFALISVALAVVVVVAALGCFVFIQYSKRRSEEAGIACHPVFFYPLRIKEQDFIMAVNEKTAICSSGTFGSVYVISLPSGELVVVKKLQNTGSQSPKSLKSEIKTVAKIRHKNIVKILGFCHTEESIFLIYEHIPKGSLGDMIGRLDFQMQWCVRLKIAIGVAQALAYLHNDYSPHMLHRDIKSENVLLGTDFEPKLTDIALDRIVGESAFQSTLAFESPSSCYIAPEYGYSKKATEQTDTYSFGVVLLELIAGRKAEPTTTDSSEESIDIVKWVRRNVNIADGAVRVLDPRLSDSDRQEMLGALQVALQCTSVMPEKRPSMVEALKALQDIGSKKLLPPNVDSGHRIPV